MTALVERLGYGVGERVLVVSCAELGVFHAGNVAIYEALRNGTATAATLLVPAPWARGAAAQYRGEDIGVGLTLNAEHDLYRWGPITHAPSLLDGDGGFPRTPADLWDHADLDEVRRECRAQLERAIYWGFDVSHLDAHLGAVQLKPEFFDVFLDLAEEFGLPLRLPDAGAERLAGFPLRSLAAERGVVSPDRVIWPGDIAARPARPEGSAAGALGAVDSDPKARLAELFAGIGPGVTEVCLRPALDTPELRAAAPDWRQRTHDRGLLLNKAALSQAADQARVRFLGYRALRELMRGR
ncbi:MAG: ChbG/HpnK family deacetylase [Acidimicrobiales bacterium]